MEGESRPASVRDQVVVRVRGEFGKIINGDGEGMRGEVMSLLQNSSPFAALSWSPSCHFMFG